MDIAVTRNPYEHYEMTVQKFKGTVSKKKEMEETFHPNMVKDYNNVKLAMVENAVELLKLGVSSRLDEENVYISIDDDEYQISRADMMKSINKKQWDALFPNENIQTIKAEIDLGNTDDLNDEKDTSDVHEQTDISMQSMDANPLAAFFTALCAPILANQNTGHNLDMNQFAVSIQNAFQPQKELSDEVGGIQRKIVKLEKQRDEAVETCKNLQNRFEAVQNEYAENEQKFQEAVKETEEKFSELKSFADSLKEQLSRKEDALKNAMKDKENIQKALRDEKNRVENIKAEQAGKIDALKNKYEDAITDANNKAKDAEEELKKAVQKVKDESSKELNSVKEQMKAVEKERDSFKEACEKSEDDVKRAKDSASEKDRKLSELEKKLKEAEDKARAYDDILKSNEKIASELAEKNREIEALKAEVEDGKKTISELQKSVDEREQENRSLAELAYNDKKMGIMNINAFNRDFPKTDKNKMSLIVTGIRNMKAINEQYGRASGDKLISVAAKACAEEFGKENVYRVFGDEFAIISYDDYRNIINRISNVKDTLMAQQINIVFGVAAGADFKKIKDVVESAEKSMEAMKNNTQAAPVQELVEQEKVSDEPEEVDMSDMLEEYMNTQN